MSIKKFLSFFLSIFMLLGQADSFVFAATKYKKHTYKQAKKVQKRHVKASVKKKTPKKSKKEDTFIIPLVKDETAEAIDKTGLKKHEYKPVLIYDEPVAALEEVKNFKRPVYKDIVFSDSESVVLLKPIKKISTKNTKVKISRGRKYPLALPEIGDTVQFTVVKDVHKDGRVVIPKNSVVTAKIGEVSPRAMGGAPAEMTVEDFIIKDKNGKVLTLKGDVASSGYNLSVWIGLVELATTPFIFGLAAPLLRVLPGGQAVITPRKEYVVYY